MRLNEIVKDAYTNGDYSMAKPYVNKILEYEKMCVAGGRAIYRGMRIARAPSVMLGDGITMNRKSSNTANYYTALTEVLPSWKNWPKRSQSFICTTNEIQASRYGEHYVVIPLENQPIAVASEKDFWDSLKTTLKMSLAHWNYIFGLILEEVFDDKFIGVSSSEIIPLLEKLNHILVNGSEALSDEYLNAARETVKQLFGTDNKAFRTNDFKKDTLAHLNKIFDPMPNGNELLTNYNLSKLQLPDSKEIWFSGKALFIINSHYGDLLNRIQRGTL